jgi:hypothetical protein
MVMLSARALRCPSPACPISPASPPSFPAGKHSSGDHQFNSVWHASQSTSKKWLQDHPKSPFPWGRCRAERGGWGPLDIRRVLLVATTVMIVSACSWKADGPARIERLYPTTAVDIADVTSEVSVAPDLIVGTNETSGNIADVHVSDFWGSYVVEMKLPATMELVPGFPPYALLLTNLFVASWSDDGLEWTYCTQVAFLDADGTGATEMLPETDAALGETPLYLSTADGLGIEEQSIAWTWGIQGMEDPFNDSLPSDPEDPLVWDQDEDGNPGVTVEVLIPKGFRHMVRRAVWNIHPPEIISGGQRFEGSTGFKVDENALGYDGDPLLLTLVDIVPDPNGGTYTMVRTDEYYSCEQLLAEYPGIF